MEQKEISREVSRALKAVAKGDPEALDRLLPLVYEKLRAMAVRQMAGERTGHTLQATGLVHEAYLKLVGGDDRCWENRARFCGAAAEAMRRILIDHARTRGRIKRGAGRTVVPLDANDLASREDPAEILAVDEAVRRLEGKDPAIPITTMRCVWLSSSLE